MESKLFVSVFSSEEKVPIKIVKYFEIFQDFVAVIFLCEFFYLSLSEKYSIRCDDVYKVCL